MAAFAGGSLASTSNAAGPFWNVKPDGEWSPEEIAELLAASPWAIPTKVKMAGTVEMPPLIPVTPTAASSAAPGLPSGGGAGRSNGTGLGRPRPMLTEEAADPRATAAGSTQNSNSPVAFYGDVVVTWESAAPIRLARKEPLDAEFENRYAIRVTGLPSQTFMPETRAVPVVARLLTGASLEVSPQRHQQAWYVMRMAEKKSLVFAFPKDKLRLSLSTGYVWFNLKVNQMVIRVRFDLRTMRFRDLLAV